VQTEEEREKNIYIYLFPT